MKDWRKLDTQYENEIKKYPHPVPSRELILKVLKEQKKALSFATLVKLFCLNRGEKETLRHRIKAMLRDGELEERASGKLRPVKLQPVLFGKVFAHAEGYGFFIPDDKTLTQGEDLYLSYRQMQKVMHGDRVKARELKSNYSHKKEGQIIEVVEHSNKRVIGRLIDDYGIWVVKAESRRIHHKILVSNLADFAVSDNQIVEVNISEYPNENQPIQGEITRVLGDSLAAGIEIDVAIANHHLPYEWPSEVIKQTVTLADHLIPSDYNNRVDLRDLPLVTIDGITARDFDDAIYAKKTQSGFKLYVAIADVANYVKKNSPLDQEAKERATSVYFPNRVIPMLPEKLSNGLCSLNPEVDRLCMVCEMLIDKQGNIKRSRFYDAVMHSKARLTYETIEDVLFTQKASLPEKIAHLLPDLQVLKALYTLLRQQRDRRGAINFHRVEPHFEYDAAGKIDRIIARQHLKSHQLIEEFMVSANVSAAKFLLKQKGKYKPVALFRNHEGPSEEKYQELITDLAQEGIKIPKLSDEVTPKQFGEILEQIKGKENFESLQLRLLRSMYQAVYQADNVGHFGLALEHYAHFTSPIRRYPDLLVHRAIKHATRCKDELYIYSLEQMQQLGEHCSMAERRADDAVYEVLDYQKCQYMQDKLGQSFAATISKIKSFGFFVELDGQFIDGLVPIGLLVGDYFHYDEQKQLLMGERSRKIYKMGHRVEVIVSEVSLDERKINFVLADKDLPFLGKTNTSPRGRAKNKKKPKKRN